MKTRNDQTRGCERRVLRAAVMVSAFAVVIAPAPAQDTGDTTAGAADRTALWAAPMFEPARPDVLGLALASKRVELKSSVPGRIDELMVEDLDAVTAGQDVARIDDAEPRVRVERARLAAETTTAIEMAELEVEATAHQVKKLTELDRSASSWERKQAEIALKQAEVRVKLEQEAHDLAQLDLSYAEAILDDYRMRAPFNGRVIRVLVEAGVSVEIDNPLMIVAQLDPLEAHLYLPLEWFDRLKRGDRYYLAAGAPVDGEVIGVVKNVDLEIDPASQTFRAVFTIDNPDERLPARFQITALRPVDGAP